MLSKRIILQLQLFPTEADMLERMMRLPGSSREAIWPVRHPLLLYDL